MGNIDKYDSRWLHGLVKDNISELLSILEHDKKHHILVPNCWEFEPFLKNLREIDDAFFFYSFETEEEMLFMMLSLPDSHEYITVKRSEI